MAEDQRFYLGQTQEEANVAQNYEGTRHAIIDSEPSRIPNKEWPSKLDLIVQIRHLPVPIVLRLLGPRRWHRPRRSKYE